MSNCPAPLSNPPVSEDICRLRPREHMVTSVSMDTFKKVNKEDGACELIYYGLRWKSEEMYEIFNVVIETVMTKSSK